MAKVWEALERSASRRQRKPCNIFDEIWEIFVLGLWRRYARGVPDYLARYYWWAYLAKPAVWFFDHQIIINAILFGQYQALMDETMHRYTARPAGRTLQLTAVYGKLTPALAAAASDSEFHLMDVATVQLELARRKLRAAKHTAPQAEHVARMNAEALAYADDSFDTIVMFFLLHEMPPAARQRTLTECARVLRPGGRLLITEYGALTTSHPLHRFAPFRVMLGKLEPFLPGFWQEDLPALLSRCAASCGKQMTLIEEKPIFGGFYRVAEFESSSRSRPMKATNSGCSNLSGDVKHGKAGTEALRHRGS